MYRFTLTIFLILLSKLLLAQSSEKENQITFKVYIDSTDAKNPFVIRGHIINGPFPYPKIAWKDSLDNHKFRVVLYFEDNCRLSSKVSYVEGNLKDEQINAIIRETTELISRKKNHICC